MSAEAYWILIDRTAKGCYYLWGPIQTALLLELENEKGREGRDLLIDICTKGPLINPAYLSDSVEAELYWTEPSNQYSVMPKNRQDMLFQVLTTAGAERSEQIHGLLHEIVGQAPQSEKKPLYFEYREAKKIAADVSGWLQYPDLLYTLMSDRDEHIRKYAIRSTFYMWREENAIWEQNKPPDEMISIQLLKEISRLPSTLVGWFAPRVRMRLQSAFSLTLALLFENYKDSRMTSVLLSLWGDVVRKILWLTPENAPYRALQERIKIYFRSGIINLLTRWAVSFVKTLGGDRGAIYDVSEFELFFQADKRLKDTFSRVVPHIDYRTRGINEIVDDLKTLALSRDMLCGYLVLAVLSSYMYQYPKEGLAVIQEIMDDVFSVSPALPAAGLMLIVLSAASNGLPKDEIDTQILEFEKNAIMRYQAEHGAISVGQNEKVWFGYSGMTSFPRYLYRKYGVVDPELIDFFIQDARDNGSYSYAKLYQYVMNVASSNHPNYRDTNAMLECLVPVFNIMLDKDLDDQPLKEKITADLVNRLALLRASSKNEIDYFMDDHSLPNEFKNMVRNKCNEEKMSAVLMRGGMFFVGDLILRRPETWLGQLLPRWFEQATDCKDVVEWVGFLIKVIVNELCNEKLL
jgi:hypothetical protein